MSRGGSIPVSVKAMPDKTPPRHAAGFPFDGTPPPACPGVPDARFRPRHNPVSGFPLPCLKSRTPYEHPSRRQAPRGPPEFSDVSLPACHGLRTPADLHTLAKPGASVLPSVCVKTLGVRNKLISKLYQHFRVRDHPYGLQDSLSTLRLSCSPLL